MPSRRFLPLAVQATALLMLVAPALDAQTETDANDPTKGPVEIESPSSWKANLVFDAGVGVWTVAAMQVQPWFATPEIVALDDRGRCTVLRSYSGKWTPQATVEDGKWFAPVARRAPQRPHDGATLYVGGAGGRLWRIQARRSGQFESHVLGEWPGEEIHSLLLEDVDGDGREELLAFLRSGRLMHVDLADQHQIVELARLPGRVRQAILLPVREGHPRFVATVGRTGELALLRFDRERKDSAYSRQVLAKEPQGLGRIALAQTGDALRIYATRDDGVILAFTLADAARGEATREIVMLGAQGPRGIVAGRFHADPKRESLAVFGYSKDVVLVSRTPGEAWESEVLFRAADKGHWLDVIEIDGRNATREIVGSGYDGRVFLLRRPVGYGLPGVHVGARTKETPVEEPTKKR